MSDARVGAWIAAWDALNAATNIIKKCPIQDPDEYRAFCQLQADIYAHLADVPAEVGVGAAEWLERREKERREQEAMFRKAFEK
ncbi:hypothetical protein SEA_GERALT_85 [Mycobacterium phage Geralt]|uniref:Uncharacterized protein n=9 Tax=Cheoctovirus TaxID=1623281 RepID=G8J7T8_9CAUD|nr:gp97 [Mycobacterium phage Ramsey]YP_008410659.1 hypothetical protein N856_gp090 [Mycobacterium phage Daenerys]YP_009018967.1 hypothetical protein CL77_gp091 [Mycobacterium phage GUmbie]YP_009198198.1 hypothetical protein SEA_KIMBERLIUM_94 [Mycobacterium phage Kimberlium]YP_009638447.1 hypothetical protein FGG38_gp86 [Mycobacterium phage DotProduct]YP_009956228.1 hypothetical protein I5H29_gp89 [Mycobacterium phage Doug]YP_009960775.1 hypothetical protein I5H73_gp089 [Mycobacterium phage Ol